jgi:two-component system LytT family response regulator
MKTRCLIVDDEPLARKLLQTHVGQLEQLELVGQCPNAIKASEMLRTTEVDLLFLDIKMPQLTGIDFLKTLKKAPAVIFTTAYREYALEGYELDVVDYLLKPITFDRFFKAIEKYHLRVAPPGNAQKIISSKQESFIYIKTGNKFHKIDSAEIIFIESVKDYIVVHRDGKEKLTAKYKISDLEEDLKGKNFLRIHRSFIINPSWISAFTHQDVELGAVQLPIGNSYKEYAMKMLKKS